MIEGNTERYGARRASAKTARAVARVATEDRAGTVLRVLLTVALLVAALASDTWGQAVPERLTLEEAIQLAVENSPTFLSQKNDQAAADWGVREAYGNFMPSASFSGSMAYTEAGVQRLGTVDFGAQSTDWYSSSYGLSLGWTLNGNTLFGVSNARASQRATAARIASARFDVESAVTLQYMAALRARDGVAVAERQLERARENYEIVGTRVETGAAAGTEGKQALVDEGRAEVALIQAEQAFAEQKLLLAERIGLSLGDDVELVSEFTIFEPQWQQHELIADAMAGHPSLQAFAAQERANKATVRQQRSGYFPSLSLSTGFSGTTLEALNDDFLVGQAESGAFAAMQSCERWKLIQGAVGEPLPGIDVSEPCGDGTLSAAQRQSILQSNDVFPFDFTKTPLSLRLSVSVPLFNGFTRQRQVEQAEAAALDAAQSLRAEELRLRTAVTQAHNAILAAFRIVEIEATNRELAEERLELARQRYSIGGSPSVAGQQLAGSTFLELLDAQASMSVAERDYLNAVYDFHLALAQLEAATGRRLRPGAAGGEGGETIEESAVRR